MRNTTVRKLKRNQNSYILTGFIAGLGRRRVPVRSVHQTRNPSKRTAATRIT
jgi:hypothetical protein